VKGIEWFKIDQSLHNMNFQNTICFFFRYKEQKSEIKKQEQLKKEKEAKKKAKEEFKKNKLQELREKGLISPSSDWTIDSDTGEPLRKAQK
jgi:hypothetical protein